MTKSDIYIQLILDELKSGNIGYINVFANTVNYKQFQKH
jgi:hypothetical protein